VSETYVHAQQDEVLKAGEGFTQLLKTDEVPEDPDVTEM
jgi:hypothetical protein